MNGYGKVHVDVTEARAGARESICVDVLPELLTPGAAQSLADDLREAVVIVDRLAPPKAIAPAAEGWVPACSTCCDSGVVFYDFNRGLPDRWKPCPDCDGPTTRRAWDHYAAATDDDGRRGD